MILYEYEGKKLLSDAGIKVPESQLVDSASAKSKIIIQAPVVLKAQVLSGKRADAGGIVICGEISNFEFLISNLFKQIVNGEKVEKILVEEKVEFDQEFYVSISYDTDTRGPILTISEQGGTGIESRKIQTFPIDPISGIISPQFATIVAKKEYLKEIIEKMVKLFFDQDCLLLEINPLVRTKNKWIALDVKIKLDDDAKKRHPDWDFPPRFIAGRSPTKNEIEAKKIDEADYRGTAGSAYFDLEGDIAVLSSGGGVSLTAMDSLINYGGKPANFTEYSGNPPKEKVAKLTKIVLTKPDLHGLWVIGTVAANFTDIHETLAGFIEGLREAEQGLNTKFEFPIVIRRGGPNEKQAFEMLKGVKDFNLILQGEETSIAESAKTMAELAKEYKIKSEARNQKIETNSNYQNFNG